MTTWVRSLRCRLSTIMMEDWWAPKQVRISLATVFRMSSVFCLEVIPALTRNRASRVFTSSFNAWVASVAFHSDFDSSDMRRCWVIIYPQKSRIKMANATKYLDRSLENSMIFRPSSSGSDCRASSVRVRNRITTTDSSMNCQSFSLISACFRNCPGAMFSMLLTLAIRQVRRCNDYTPYLRRRCFRWFKPGSLGPPASSGFHPQARRRWPPGLPWC